MKYKDGSKLITQQAKIILFHQLGQNQNVIFIETMISNFLLIFMVILLFTYEDDSILSWEFFTNHFTDNDFIFWNIAGNYVPPDHLFSQCGSERIFGGNYCLQPSLGYKRFGGDPMLPLKISHHYVNLISHYGVRIQAKLYKIDSWNNQSLFIMVDNTAQKIYTFGQANSSQNICGDLNPSFDSINTNFNDSVIVVDFAISHVQNTLDLSFQTNLNSDRGWWGIRDIKITLLLCDKSCKTCTNSSACLSCQTAVTGLVLVGAFCQCTAGQIKQLITACTSMPCVRCVSACSTGYYSSAITAKCEPCHPACLSCSVGSNTIGPACDPCSPGYFRTNSLAEPCSNCLGGCSSCTALTSVDCTQCKDGYFLRGRQCLSQCPAGTYSQQRPRKCKLCQGSCNTCDGGTNSHCLSCTGNLYLTASNQCQANCSPFFFKYSNKCYSQCPGGTFADTTLFICSLCSANCKQCTSFALCLKCASEFYLIGGTCQNSCPKTHYASKTIGQCLICHLDCLQCFGPSSTSCKFCSDPTKFLWNAGCYQTCPLSTYSNLCLPCHSTCLSCVGSKQTDCISCPSSTFYDLSYHTCLQACPSGAIVDKAKSTCQWCPNSKVGYFHQCVSCNPTCQTCYGRSFMECSSCQAGFAQYMTTCIQKDEDKLKIIKSQAKSLSTKTLTLTFFLATISICVFLEMCFTYKTVLLPLIEFIQILSYCLFLSIPMSQQIQEILQMFYYTNFTAHLFVQSLEIVGNLPLKLSLMGKTGYYAIDTLGIHIVMLIGFFVTILIKKIRFLSSIINLVYEKINPCLISYLYRLSILDQFFSLIIYLRYGGVDNAIGIISLILLFLDILIVGLTFIWKIKTSNQQKQEYALLYFNEIQYNYEDSITSVAYSDSNEGNILHGIKSSFIGIVFYLGKIPFPLSIVFFINNSSYQAIAICGYAVFFFIILLIVPYKRKIYRFLNVIGTWLLIISSAILIGAINNENLSIGLQILWIIYILLNLAITLLQLLINYKLFIYIFKYIIYRIGDCLAYKSPSESPSNGQQLQKSVQDIKKLENQIQQNLNKSEDQQKKNHHDQPQIIESQTVSKSDQSKSADSQQSEEAQAGQKQNFTKITTQKQMTNRDEFKDKLKNQKQHTKYDFCSYIGHLPGIQRQQRKNSDDENIQLDLNL